MYQTLMLYQLVDNLPFKTKATMKSIQANFDVKIWRHKIVFSQIQNYSWRQPRYFLIYISFPGYVVSTECQRVIRTFNLDNFLTKPDACLGIFHKMRKFMKSMVPSLLSPYGALTSRKLLTCNGCTWKNM